MKLQVIVQGQAFAFLPFDSCFSVCVCVWGGCISREKKIREELSEEVKDEIGQ